MKKHRLLLWVTLCLLCFGIARSQGPQAPDIPFHRGINLSGWLRGRGPGQIRLNSSVKQDLINFKTLGCDVVRLVIGGLHTSLTSGSPDYIINPAFFSSLDSVVTWAEELHIYLIFDNHTLFNDVRPAPIQAMLHDLDNILAKVWTQVAEHYKGRSDLIMYEILNEPHDLDASRWGFIQGKVIDAIRTVDKKHTIVVGGVDWNDYKELRNLPVYSDPNLIYTFHFYDPFMFTHQGATWTLTPLTKLSGVPFPYNASKMPPCPDVLKGTDVEMNLKEYKNDGTAEHIKSLIDLAVDLKNTRHVRIFCGEFGALDWNSDPAERVNWYSIVTRYLQEKGIAWTIWDYRGGFGLFNKGSKLEFNHDLNIPLLKALGFNVPPQTK
jgi:endoglucanase